MVLVGFWFSFGFGSCDIFLRIIKIDAIGRNTIDPIAFFSESNKTIVKL